VARYNNRATPERSGSLVGWQRLSTPGERNRCWAAVSEGCYLLER
jgi:hypothetical protein